MTADMTAGVILAGGQSRRMQRNKSFCRLAKRPLIAHVIDAMTPQLYPLAINIPAAGAAALHPPKKDGGENDGSKNNPAHFGLPLIADVIDGHCGPLAGVLTGMLWAGRRQQRFLVTVTTDSPFLPADLVARLHAQRRRTGADIIRAKSGDRHHPTIALWPVHLADRLHHDLCTQGVRKIDAWTQQFRRADCCYDTTPFDPFFNINHPRDLERAESIRQTHMDAIAPMNIDPSNADTSDTGTSSADKSNTDTSDTDKPNTDTSNIG